jgi:hypothetical protein
MDNSVKLIDLLVGIDQDQFYCVTYIKVDGVWVLQPANKRDIISNLNSNG